MQTHPGDKTPAPVSKGLWFVWHRERQTSICTGYGRQAYPQGRHERIIDTAYSDCLPLMHHVNSLHIARCEKPGFFHEIKTK